MQVTPKGHGCHHNSATILKVDRECMGLMTSQLPLLDPGQPILRAFVVPKWILSFTAIGWSVQPYSINFGFDQNKKVGQYSKNLSHPPNIFQEIVLAAS